MKLILHLFTFGFCLVAIQSELLTNLRDNFLRYLVSTPLRHANSGGDHKPEELNSAVKPTVDYEALKQLKNNNEWEKKHWHGVKVENAHNSGEGKDQEGNDFQNKLYLSAFKKGDGVDQAIPKQEPPPMDSRLTTIGIKYFHMDPVLNALRRRSDLKSHLHPSAETNLRYDILDKNLRRSEKKDGTSSSDSGSSSLEMKDFKDEFRELWLHKKFEALNKSKNLDGGDNVNMVAARPWGVPCGDPNQHDMPWGVCTLSSQCDSEFRVYRGDFFCGRTQFVCCGLQLTSYDLYQGFDASFDDKSLSTDSDERRERQKSSKEKKKKRILKERKNRRKVRQRRKKKIKSNIKKIVKEMKKILDKQYKNGTKLRKTRTKQLKKFIKDLKRQYKKDRQSVKDLHTHDMIHIDKRLLDKLKQIQLVNRNFAKNATFREVVLKEMISKQSARMLVDAYPELNEFLEVRRRTGGGLAAKENENSNEEGLHYDVEYGYLYY
ncbi:hypothetical protein O0L34_g12995 [Tuta absoluta]|nr:hypothetical protein O0L34_g12995 [Tuta absoluta]